MVDPLTVLIGIIAPLSIAAFGWTWRQGIDKGRLWERVRDLAKQINQINTEQTQLVKDLNQKTADLDVKINELSVRLARVETDVRWLRNYFEQNTRSDNNQT